MKTVWTKKEKDIWRIPEKLSVSECADKIRILPPDCAEPGPYRTARTPYMRKPMDAFGNPIVEELDLMFARQMGKSTAEQNMIATAVEQDPADAQYVVPRERDVDYTKEKVFKPMIELSEALLRHISSPRDLQGDYFSFDRMTLYFGWAGSTAELKQKHIKYLFFDEPTAYPAFSGRESNPIDIAIKTTTTFWDRKIVRVSTPVSPLDYIDGPYQESNKEKYYIPCPHCGEYSIWTWIQFKKPEKLKDPDEIIREGVGCVWYECPHCTRRIEEIQKEILVAAGEWLPEGQTIDADGNIHGRPLRSKRHSGFNAAGWISPFEGMSWPRIMAKWLKANTEEGIAQGALIDFKNSIEAVPFEEIGKKLKTSELKKLTGGFSKGTVPDWVVLLVASADYHKSRTRGIVRIDYTIKGYGYGLKNCTIKSGHASSFDKLDEEVLLSPFPWSDGTPNEQKPWLAVMIMFIDSGYQKTREDEPDEVYEYCRQRPGLTIPTKGVPGPLLKPLTISDLESATERRLTQKQRRRYRGMQLIIVDTHYFKNQVQSWAEPQRNEKGEIVKAPLLTFYSEIPYYYLTEFSNEHKIKKRDRNNNIKWIWEPVSKGAPTHSLDLEVLAAAAGYYKGVHYLKAPGEKKAAPAAATRGKKKIRLSDLQRQKRLR